ncbi:MAG: (deoxy)nucleoside triphosphate pyrophosphohydrolase [Pseudomonadota bacterium]
MPWGRADAGKQALYHRPDPVRVLTVVAGLLVDGDGHVLITQRPQGKAMAGLWEFPGGKLEVGESPEAALARELYEELGLTVRPDDLKPFTFASHRYEEFHLLMPLFVCRTWDGTPIPREVADIRFVPPDRLTDFAMPEADAPLVEHIQTAFRE